MMAGATPSLRRHRRIRGREAGIASLAAGLALVLALYVPAAHPALAGSPGTMGCRDSAPGAIRTDGLFHDGGPLYLQPSDPGAYAPVTLTLRTDACDVGTASLIYHLTADQPRRSVPMRRIGRDRTARYDLWRAMLRTGPAGSTLTYRFEVQDHGAVDWFGAEGVATTAYGAGYFTIAPGFHTPSWAQDAIFYQIFPDRFKNGGPHNDVRTGENS